MSLEDAERVLRDAGIGEEELMARHGWSNEAWIGSSVVVRLSNGRFAGAFAHEASVCAALAGSGVPHAEVLGHGDRDNGQGEWLISRRVPGTTLADAWLQTSADGRRSIGRQLGTIMRAMHTLPARPGPKCWQEALGAGRTHDAYHPPPHVGELMAAEAANLPGAPPAVAAGVIEMLHDRADLFAHDGVVFGHFDLHGHNVMVEQGRVTGVLDWELAHPGSSPMELDALIRWCTDPQQINRSPLVEEQLRPVDLVDLVRDVAESYPELFETPNLHERLEVYDVHWHLVQILCQHRLGSGDQEAIASRWAALGSLLEGRSHLRRVAL